MKKALIKGLIVIFIMIILVAIATTFGRQKDNEDESSSNDIFSKENISDETNDNTNKEIKKIEKKKYEECITIAGTVEKIDKTKGMIFSIRMADDTIAKVYVDPSILKIDDEGNKITTINNVKVNDMIGFFVNKDVNYDEVIDAIAVIYGKIKDNVTMSLHTIEEIKVAERGATVLTDDESLELTVLNETMFEYETNDEMNAAELEVGDIILTSYDNVQESYPAQAFSIKTIVIKKDKKASIFEKDKVSDNKETKNNKYNKESKDNKNQKEESKEKEDLKETVKEVNEEKDNVSK